MKKITFYMFIASILVGCGGGGSTEPTNGTQSPTGVSAIAPVGAFEAPAIEASVRQAYLRAINNARRVRQNCGAEGNMDATTPLVWNDALYRAAYSHSEDMAQSDTFSHTGSGTDSDWTAQVLSLGRGSTTQERIEQNGYINFRGIGENLTAGTDRDTAEEAVAAWLASPGHCKNIMSPNFRDVGMAHVERQGTKFIHYWTQKLGSK